MKQEESKIVLSSWNLPHYIEISFDEFGTDIDFGRYIDKQPEHGYLIESGPTDVAGFPFSYVKVFEDGEIHKIQYFLFRKGRVINLLAYPAQSELGEIVDRLIGTIKID